MLLLQVMSFCSGGVREVWQTCCLLVFSALHPAVLSCQYIQLWHLVSTVSGHIYIQLCDPVSSVSGHMYIQLWRPVSTVSGHIYIQLWRPANGLICIQLLVCCIGVLLCGFYRVVWAVTESLSLVSLWETIFGRFEGLDFIVKGNGFSEICGSGKGTFLGFDPAFLGKFG